MAFRGGVSKSYSVGMTKIHPPRKKVTVSYVIRDEEERLNRSGVNALRIDPNTRHLYTAGRDSIIRCWDISAQDQCDYVRSLEHHTDWINDIVLCMDGQHIMSASSDITLKLWDARRGACTSTLRQQQDYIKCLAYSRHRELVASGSLDNTIYLWDIRTLTSLTATNNKVTTTSLRGQRDSVYSLALNEAGTVLVAGGTDKVLQVWDPRTDDKLMKLKGHTDNVRALLLSPDGTTCVSGSSDGTIRLWSLGQQRCIETFRMHEEGVWSLASDDTFQVIYSGGRDKKVYATELRSPSVPYSAEGNLLFVADAPVLCLTHDPCGPKESVWVATTEPHITKWTYDPDTCEEDVEGEGEREGGVEGEGEGELEGEEAMEVTDIDDYGPACLMKKTIHVPGGPSIREYRILGNRQHVLTRDSNGHVQLWDILHAVKEADLGEVDIEEEAEKRKSHLYIPNWFSVEVKTGMLSIKLSESDCFSAWVMGASANLDTATPDLKLNLGALQLRALFEHWPSARPLVTSPTTRSKQQHDDVEDSDVCEEKQPGTGKDDETSKTSTTATATDKKDGEKRESGEGEVEEEEGKEEVKKQEEGKEELEKEEGKGEVKEGEGEREDATENFKVAEESMKVEKIERQEEKITENRDKQNKHKNVQWAPPKLEQAMSECDDVVEWVELGAALHTPQSDLDSIEHSHGEDPARCRRELFKLWLKSSEDASWSELAAALEATDNMQQAERIRTKYLTGPVTETPPTSPSSSFPPTTVNGTNTDKVNIKFFSVPPHTPVILAESGDCATTLVRLLCRDAGGSLENRQLNNCCPIWVMDIVCQRKLPDHPKMNFSVGKYVTAGGKDRKASKNIDRLSAQDVISVQKVLDYVYSKMEPQKTGSGSDARKGAGNGFEILCQDQVLDLDLDLRTVRYKYWKLGGEMKLYYREAEQKPPAEVMQAEEGEGRAETNLNSD